MPDTKLNKDLLEYVRQQRSGGIADAEIRRALLINHWPIADIDQVVAQKTSKPRGQGVGLLTKIIIGFFVVVFIEAGAYAWSTTQFHSQLANSPFATTTSFVPEALTPITGTNSTESNLQSPPVNSTAPNVGTSYSSGGTSQSTNTGTVSTQTTSPSLIDVLSEELLALESQLASQTSGSVVTPPIQGQGSNGGNNNNGNGGGNGGGGGGQQYQLPTCSLSADPASITSGDSSTLTWSTTNTSSIVITPDIGDSDLSGSQTVSPTNTTVYNLEAIGPGGIVNCDATLVVNSAPPPPPPTCSLSASPTSINLGDPTTLTWSTTDATSVSITPDVGSVDTSGSTSDSPTQSTTYTLAATGPGGTTNCTAEVTVNTGGGGQAPARLSTSGSQILDPSGNPIVLRGFDWGDWGTPLPQDAADNVSQGANYIRLPLSWYFGSGTGATDCGTGQDSYDPQSPQTGYINPANLAILDQEISWASAAHIWVDLMVRGGDCDFWTNPVIIPQYLQMWQFLANRYKDTPYIGSYEILSEPHPATLKKVPNEAIVKALAIQNITSIRAIDPVTPIVVGAAQTYDIRNMQTAYMPGIPNIIYTANFFELPAYVKSEKGKDADIGYPGNYVDGNYVGDFACTYPNEGNGQSVYMDKTWLAGLLTCATNFRSQYNVPIYINQVGLFTSTQDAMQYTSDVLGLFNQNNISWTWWTYRAKGIGADPNSQAMLYQDANGVWQTKTDWLNLISSFFTATNNNIAQTNMSPNATPTKTSLLTTVTNFLFGKETTSKTSTTPATTKTSPSSMSGK
jgi:hypothetical protein